MLIGFGYLITKENAKASVAAQFSRNAFGILRLLDGYVENGSPRSQKLIRRQSDTILETLGEAEGLFDLAIIRTAYTSFNRGFDAMSRAFDKRNALIGIGASGEQVRLQDEVIEIISIGLISDAERIVSIAGRAEASSREAAQSFQRNAIFIILTVSLLTAVAIIVLTMRVGQSIYTPLEQLSKSAEKIGSGRLNEPVPQLGEDEIGQLGNTLDQMRQDLQLSIGNLNRHRAELAQEVESQTKEATEAKDIAIAANAAKGRFLATMSHEIRTPMNGLMGTAEILAKTAKSPETSKMADSIFQASKSLLRILDDILVFCKIEAGEISIALEDLDLAEDVLAPIESIVWPIAAKKNVELSIKIADPAKGRIVSDGVRLRQILLNLLDNAIKFSASEVLSRPGVVSLTISKGIDGSWIFEVEDNGVGFQESAMNDLYHPFRQLEDSTTRRFGGTGLGLAITYDLVELLGGSIDAKSEAGSGSRFVVVLPQHSVGSAMPNSGRDEPKRVLDSSIKVLVVEDNDANRDLFSLQLKYLGLTATMAANGQEGLDIFLQQRFDIVLTDFQMPRMDGKTMAGKIRAFETQEVRNPTPIIGITGDLISQGNDVKAEMYIDDVLGKPYTIETLRATIAKWT